MSKRSITLLVALTLLLAACGPQATPTMNPADVQGTAVAAAWTMVAETQAALPTATLPPPTNTPSPTSLPTFTALPPSTIIATGGAGVTLAAPTATQAASSGSTDNCLAPLDMGEAGPTAPVRIENESGGVARVSLTMYQKNAFGQCGAIGVGDIAKNGSQRVELPKGLWFAYAWITFSNGSSSTASGSFELTPASEDLTRLVIGRDVISAKAP